MFRTKTAPIVLVGVSRENAVCIVDERVLRARSSVSGRSKPASDGRLKTNHFEEMPIRQVALSIRPVPHEANHVQSAQSGHDRNHLVAPSTRLTESLRSALKQLRLTWGALVAHCVELFTISYIDTEVDPTL